MRILSTHIHALMGMTRIFPWLAILPLCQASTVKEFKLEELVSHSSHIIVGRCLKTESRWNPKGTLILTYSLFTVEQHLKGNASSQVTVVTVGGTVGDTTQAVSGMPRFTPGREALLFLEPSRTGDLQVVGMALGHFTIVMNSRTGRREAVRSLAGLDFVGSDTKSTSREILPGRLTLDDLTARIQQLLSRPSTR
jgi:hypothetical protein